MDPQAPMYAPVAGYPPPAKYVVTHPPAMDRQAVMYPPVVAGYPPPANYVVTHPPAMDRQAVMNPPVVAGYPPSASYAVHQPYPSAPVMRDGYGNPYVYAQEVKPAHAPDCRYGSPDRRHRNSIANAIAAIFIVCWCCTWPCHGPCCCGF